MTPTKCALGLLALILAACASSKPSASKALALGSDEVILGERITFTGVDGEPVVPVPAVYRVEAKGDDRLALYRGAAKKPLLVRAETHRLDLAPEEREALEGTRAFLHEDPASPARTLWVVGSDGAAHGAAGYPEGVRTRGDLLVTTATIDRSVWIELYTSNVSVTSPRAETVYWNRFRPLRVNWEGAERVRVNLVHRVTGSVVSSASGTARFIIDRLRGAVSLTGLEHLDPGRYDVVVIDLERIGSATTWVRVVGRARSLAANGPHRLALRAVEPAGALGRVWAWGDNQFGQCGPQATGTSVALTATDVVAVAVAAGQGHSLALTANGEVVSWGDNRKDQLGRHTPHETDSDPAPIPKPSEFVGQVVEIAAGGDFGLALDKTGTVWAWGSNDSGQCGQGGGSEPTYAQPVPVKQADGAPLTGVAAIAAGKNRALALKADGSILQWGYLDYWGPGSPGWFPPMQEGPVIAWLAREFNDTWTAQARVYAIDAQFSRCCAQWSSDLALDVWGFRMARVTVRESVPEAAFALGTWHVARKYNSELVASTYPFSATSEVFHGVRPLLALTAAGDETIALVWNGTDADVYTINETSTSGEPPAKVTEQVAAEPN